MAGAKIPLGRSSRLTKAVFMCGRFTLRFPGRIAQVRFPGVTVRLNGLSAQWKPRFNLGPGQQILFLKPSGPAGLTLREGHWGWPSPVPGRKELLINARSETAAEKSLFRTAWENERVLIPADGYYEWKRDTRPPRPFFFALPDNELFWMAGLRRVTGPSGPDQIIVLTQPAVEPASSIHHRMPLFVSPAISGEWFKSVAHRMPRTAEPGQIAPGLAALTVREVNPRVNSLRYDDPVCLAPPPVHQLELPLD